MCVYRLVCHSETDVNVCLVTDSLCVWWTLVWIQSTQWRVCNSILSKWSSQELSSYNETFVCTSADTSERARRQTDRQTQLSITHKANTHMTWVLFLTGLSNKSVFKKKNRKLYQSDKSQSWTKWACESGACGDFSHANSGETGPKGLFTTKTNIIIWKSNQTLFNLYRPRHRHQLSKRCCWALTHKLTSPQSSRASVWSSVLIYTVNQLIQIWMSHSRIW